MGRKVEVEEVVEKRGEERVWQSVHAHSIPNDVPVAKYVPHS